VELQRYLAILRRRWLLVVLTIAVALAAVYATRPRTVTYSAESRIYIGSRNVTGDLSSDNERALERITLTFAVMLPSEPIARDAVELTGVDLAPLTVASSTQARVIPGTNLLRIIYRDEDPGRALTMANGMAEAFVSKVQQFEPGIGREGDVPVLPAYVFERARFPTAPDSTGGFGSYATAALFGFVLAAAVAGILDHLDLTVKTPQEIESRLGIPVLGVVHAHRPGLRDVDGPDQAAGSARPVEAPLRRVRRTRKPAWLSAVEEAHQRDEGLRVIRSSLEFATSSDERRSILVTSAASGEGKTSTVSGLAIALANAGRRVVAVDFDLRGADLHNRLGGHNEIGVTDVLLDRRGLSECLQFIPTGGTLGGAEQGLYLLAAGPAVANPAELLGTHRTRRTLAALAETADVILLDSPPVLAVADALVVAHVAKCAVLIAEAGKTTYPQVQLAHDTLTRAGVKVVGLVLNKMRFKSPTDIYSYGYSYGSYVAPQQPQPRGDAPVADEQAGDGNGSEVRPVVDRAP
jgi:receptor protein-tyrosine kinase